MFKPSPLGDYHRHHFIIQGKEIHYVEKIYACGWLRAASQSSSESEFDRRVVERERAAVFGVSAADAADSYIDSLVVSSSVISTSAVFALSALISAKDDVVDDLERGA